MQSSIRPGSPPAYSRGSVAPATSTSRGGPPWTEHLYTLMNSRGVPWATLKIYSRAHSPNHLPSFLEGEDMRGTLQLDLAREDNIKAISVTINGQITTSVEDVYSFLHLSETLWSTSMGDPTASSTTNPIKFRGKLRGRYEWPFSFAIPENVELKSRSGSVENWRIPPSFSERMTRVHIQYQLTAHIRRGKFRVDSQLGTVFSFTPVITPAPFSLPRQVAYIENASLSGPYTDPSGWETLPPVEIRGTVFSSRAVSTTCNLFLAKPLCYTRGSVIPCFISIECTDAQALDLFSMPRALDIRLTRDVSMGLATVSNINTKTSSYGISFEATSHDVKAAIFWPCADGVDSHTRMLWGEIHLPRELKPSFRVGKFTLSYAVTVHSLKAVAFVPDQEIVDPLQSRVVEIATTFAPGPRPRTYCPSPPSYDDTSSIGQVPEFSLFRVCFSLTVTADEFIMLHNCLAIIHYAINARGCLFIMKVFVFMLEVGCHIDKT